ncbi:MAG: type II secretion system major pseudopilin GspG [Arenicella sp.]|nr:type II secretion system major pseudopilin GspG [Arenicella sp.]
MMKNMTMQKKMSKAQAGFTLIEIMVVVIIIGLLSTMVVPNLFQKQVRAYQIKAGNDISSMSSELELYRLDNFSYPTTSEGLRALVTNPGKSNWSGYLSKLPKDPWGNDFQYQAPGTRNPDSYDLWSFGSDGLAGGEKGAKDVGNWEEAK